MSKVEVIEERIEEIQQKINLLRGSIKVDTKEASNHSTIVKGLGDYADITPLRAGDYAFNTRFSKIARIEHKTWDGLIQDIGSHRVTDQLRRQLNDISIILLEGYITTTHSGMIRTQTREWRQRPFTWLWNYLLSAQLAGVLIYFSPNEYMTSKVIISIFDYLNKQEHTAFSQRQKLVSMHPGLTPKQLMLSAIPTVGSDLAVKLDEHFHHSIQELCNADVNELMKIAGIGEHKASVIYRFVRNII